MAKYSHLIHQMAGVVVAVTARKALNPRHRASPHEIEAAAKRLRRSIRKAWNEFQDALGKNGKDRVRALHVKARQDSPGPSQADLTWALNKYAGYFIPGAELEPEKISPRLVVVERRTDWEDLFKLCRATWSMPYSKGYGRRLRFVVYDDYHEAVIGIIGLQSPPADLSCRDALFQLPKEQKLDLVNCTLDAYTIGAIQPYSSILGGKLVASLVASEAIRHAYWRAYAGKKSVMRKKRLKQPLLAVTTTSAFGRSSIYNRLRFNDRLLAEPIGWTKGYGTVHLEAIYPQIEEWLEMCGELRFGGYGNGPKVRWQNISTALHRLGLGSKYAVHGLQREVFLFRHVANLEAICATDATPEPIACNVCDLSDHWKRRWGIPRSKRDESWRTVETLANLRSAVGLA